jgi:hypothetical protein
METKDIGPFPPQWFYKRQPLRSLNAPAPPPPPQTTTKREPTMKNKSQDILDLAILNNPRLQAIELTTDEQSELFNHFQRILQNHPPNQP